jgi:hypothetical protein
MAVLDDFVDDARKFEPPLDHGIVDGSRLVNRLPMNRSTAASGPRSSARRSPSRRLGSRWC